MGTNLAGNRNGPVPSTRVMPSSINRCFFTGKMIVNPFEMIAETLTYSATVLAGMILPSGPA